MMRIKKARIQNFKSIIDSKEINFDDKITAFIGKNEQGKTNFLKSLITIDKNYSYNRDDLCYRSNFDLQCPVDPIITLWFNLNKEDKEYFKKINLNLQNQDTLRISKFFDNTYNIYFVESTSNNEIQVGYEVWSKDEKKELLGDIENLLKKNVKLMSRKNEEDHLRFVISLQTPEGGFRNDMNHLPSLSATYHAIAISKKMNSLDRIKKEKVIEYILANEDKEDKENVGFKNGTDLSPTLESTFYAIMSLEYLQSIEKLNRDKYINYVQTLQNNDGGFSHKKRQDGNNVESRMDNTYFSVKILKSLNGLEKKVTDKIIGFIKDSENITGGYGSQSGAKADIASTFYAITALNEIDDIKSIEMIDHRKLFEFIESMEKSNNVISSELDTFYEVMALDGIIIYEEESLKKIKENIEKRILSGEIENGGFSYTGKMQQLDSTFYALSIIKTFEDDLEISAYVDMKMQICHKAKPNYDKILNYLKDYKSRYIVEGDIDALFKNIMSKYDKKGNVESKILEHLPNIVYSDDRMDLLKDNVKIYELKNNKDKYKTILNLFLISEISIDILNSKTGIDRLRLTKAASTKITNMLENSWRQEKDLKINVWMDGDEVHFCVEFYGKN
jgi:prenyltransferase beta subunit